MTNFDAMQALVQGFILFTICTTKSLVKWTRFWMIVIFMFAGTFDKIIPALVNVGKYLHDWIFSWL